MTTRQTAGATAMPTAATLVATPPWARVEAPQGRSHAESRSRTADRAAHTPADDTTQVSAVSAPLLSRRIPMTRDPHSPAPAHGDPPSTPEPGPAGKPALLSQRTALILFIAVVVGIGIGVLTFFAEKSYPKAALASLLAIGGCTVTLHNLID